VSPRPQRADMLTQAPLLDAPKRKPNKVLTFGMPAALALAVNREDNNMDQACGNQEMTEPKYFLLWAAVWIVALAVFLPLLK
jgi:hypothetical protein